MKKLSIGLFCRTRYIERMGRYKERMGARVRVITRWVATNQRLHLIPYGGGGVEGSFILFLTIKCVLTAC